MSKGKLPLGPEFGFALDMARRAPSNESPWLYIRGLLKSDGSLLDLPRLEELASKYILCVPLRALLVWIYDTLSKDGGKALALCSELATSIDTIHEKYWNHRVVSLKEKYNL